MLRLIAVGERGSFQQRVGGHHDWLTWRKMLHAYWPEFVNLPA
ncbi:MAG: hypothetical protein ACR2GQ_02625 [Gemmatimonadota bacterium]